MSETQFLSVRQAAQILGVSPQTLYCWIAQKRLPITAYHIGRKWLLDQASLVEYLAKVRVEPQHEGVAHA